MELNLKIPVTALDDVEPAELETLKVIIRNRILSEITTMFPPNEVRYYGNMTFSVGPITDTILSPF